jgi:hypothetical protein
MARLPICCDTIGKLDGGAARAVIDAAIRDAVADLEDRGHEDEKPRKVEILLTLEMLDNGQVGARVEAAAKVPRRRIASTIGEIRRDGRDMKVVFAEYAPDDPTQKTIDEVEPRDD